MKSPERPAGSGASGIDASVSLPLCRDRGAMVGVVVSGDGKGLNHLNATETRSR